MKAYTAEQVRAAERPLIDAGVPLMQRAALALADEISTIARRAPEIQDAGERARVLLVVGSGNNGGDALFAGAILAARGMRVDAVQTSERAHPEGLSAAERAGATIVDAAGIEASGYDVIVDAVLGTGASGSVLRGRARETVGQMLQQLGGRQHPVIVACDLPSGIHPDSGEVADACVLSADVTVTFGAVKTGLLREPASRYVGRLVVADIGLGSELERLVDPR